MAKRTLVWVGAIAATWVTAVTVARSLAPRLDAGDESSTEIRRGLVAGELQMPALTGTVRRVHLDLALAGAQIGWATGTTLPEAGVDVTVHAKMAGLEIAAPPGTRVWFSSKGPGGVDVKGAGVTRVDSAHEANLRLRCVLVFAGVAVKPA